MTVIATRQITPAILKYNLFSWFLNDYVVEEKKEINFSVLLPVLPPDNIKF